MAGPPVLLVDDDPEICQFLAMLLELEGFTPVSASRADEALAIARRDAPAAVLVDVAMPDVDGLELCRRLRAGGLSAPILVVSARPGQELLRRAAEAGADEFIRKPFENAELVEKLRGWIARRPRSDGQP
ncbi:MAG TPA: response regulator [Anaeromyxobacteraceae bacterium]